MQNRRQQHSSSVEKRAKSIPDLTMDPSTRPKTVPGQCPEPQPPGMLPTTQVSDLPWCQTGPRSHRVQKLLQTQAPGLPQNWAGPCGPSLQTRSHKPASRSALADSRLAPAPNRLSLTLAPHPPQYQVGSQKFSLKTCSRARVAPRNQPPDGLFWILITPAFHYTRLQ